MTKTKYYYLFALSLFCYGVSRAQTVYESPCVVDGKTFQLTIPKDFFKVETESIMRTAFSTEESLDPNFGSKELSKMALANIVLYYEDRNDNSLDWYVKKIEGGSNDINSSLEILNSPKIIEINNREILFAASKGTISNTTLNVIYTAVFPYGERMVQVGYIATEKLTEFMAFDEFKEIFSSLNEIETKKEDCIYGDFMDEALKLIDGELRQYTKYENNLFETDFSSSEIMPISDSDWKENFGASKHLLEEYIYKQDKGSIQVFSGGRVQDYPESKKMELAIQKVLGSTSKPTITYHSKCSSDSYNFKKYNVSGAGAVSSVYTAEIENELVFFLIDEGSKPTPDFKSAAHDYIMLFSFINWDDNPPVRMAPPPPPANGGHR